MSIKAKFRCNSITEHEGGNKEVKMVAVYSTTGENADFTKYTPSGQFSMNISPETAAVNYFKPGKEYYLTFEEATTA